MPYIPGTRNPPTTSCPRPATQRPRVPCPCSACSPLPHVQPQPQDPGVSRLAQQLRRQRLMEHPYSRPQVYDYPQQPMLLPHQLYEMPPLLPQQPPLPMPGYAPLPGYPPMPAYPSMPMFLPPYPQFMQAPNPYYSNPYLPFAPQFAPQLAPPAAPFRVHQPGTPLRTRQPQNRQHQPNPNRTSAMPNPNPPPTAQAAAQPNPNPPPTPPVSLAASETQPHDLCLPNRDQPIQQMEEMLIEVLEVPSPCTSPHPRN